MYKILVKSFIPEASEFPQSLLLREQLLPELELVPQFGSRSEVFSEEGNTTELQQQSLQGSSSFPTASKEERWGLKEPLMSLPCPTAMGALGVSHKPPESTDALGNLFGLHRHYKHV